MYNWQDILIIGDSFCQHRDTVNSWPYKLLSLLTVNNTQSPPRGKGFSGGSWWSTRKKLLTELELQVPKVLILCHTEYNRLPNDYDFGLNAISAEHDSENFSRSNLYGVGKDNQYAHLYSTAVARAAVLYYKYLNSLEFNYWSRNNWFDEVETLCDKFKIEKVIHLHSFYDFVDNKGPIYPRVFKNAATAQEILWEICDDKEKFSKANYNHFNQEKNIKIANKLYEQINNYQTGLFSLDISG